MSGDKKEESISSSLFLAGLGIAAFGFGGQHVYRYMPYMRTRLMKMLESISMPGRMKSFKYYNGGFEQRMTKIEAARILGISPSSSKAIIKEAHKRIMLLNHPDRGGSPYLAAKINEAKDFFDRK